MNTSPLFMVFLGIFLITWTCSNFLSPSAEGALPNSSSSSSSQGDTFITSISEEQVADGLDLAALPAVLQEVKTAEEFEQKINEPGGINNLDLNNDQVVDYINVSELKNEQAGTHGFQLSSEVEPGQIQDIATIEVKQDGEQVAVNAYGNEAIYGQNNGYSSTFPLGSFLLMSYFLSPHSLFSSPYGYGSYPSGYRSYNSVPRGDYASRAQRFQSRAQATQTTSRSSFATPSRNAESGIKKSLRNPTASQRSFQVRERDKAVRSGGFGKNSSKPRSSFFGGGNSRVRSFSSSRRGFGGFGK